MLLLFKTLVELFGYPGRERWQWRDFVFEHRDVLTADEYQTAMRWLSVGTVLLDTFFIEIDPELGDK